MGRGMSTPDATGAGATDAATPPHETGARATTERNPDFCRRRVCRRTHCDRVAGRRHWPAVVGARKSKSQTPKALSVDNT